jgi:hypothetical protein
MRQAEGFYDDQNLHEGGILPLSFLNFKFIHN